MIYPLVVLLASLLEWGLRPDRVPASTRSGRAPVSAALPGPVRAPAVRSPSHFLILLAVVAALLAGMDATVPGADASRLAVPLLTAFLLFHALSLIWARMVAGIVPAAGGLP